MKKNKTYEEFVLAQEISKNEELLVECDITIRTKANSKEAEVQELIVEYLERHQWFVIERNTGGIYDPTKKTFRTSSRVTKGDPDICIHKHGVTIYIEVKRSKNWKWSDKQKEFAINARNVGIPYYLVNSVDCLITENINV